MNVAPDLVLRDIHEPLAPAWWPPAPGWWIVLACVLATVAWFAWRRWRRIALRRRAARLFDDALAVHAPASAQRIAAMSELLRRASRVRNPAADRLQGADWLRFLDEGLSQPGFTEGAGQALLDGGFRRNAQDIDFGALERLVRQRFLDWMAPR